MSDEKGSVHPYPLQHVLRLLSCEFLVEPRLTQVTVLLGHRETQDLLKGRALQRVTLQDGERERGREVRREEGGREGRKKGGRKGGERGGKRGEGKGEGGGGEGLLFHCAP